MIYSLAILRLDSFTMGLAVGFGRVSLCEMWKPISDLAVSTPKATCRMTNWSLVILRGLGSIPNAGISITTIASLWRPTIRGSGVPQPFHRLKWKQSQALPGEAQSSPFRKFGTISVDKSSCIYTVVVACISLH